MFCCHKTFISLFIVHCIMIINILDGWNSELNIPFSLLFGIGYLLTHPLPIVWSNGRSVLQETEATRPIRLEDRGTSRGRGIKGLVSGTNPMVDNGHLCWSVEIQSTNDVSRVARSQHPINQYVSRVDHAQQWPMIFQG